MKIRTLIMITALLAVASCRNTPEYPQVIAKTETFEAPSALVTDLGIVGVFSGYYHLEDGFSDKQGKTVICLSKDKQYTVLFYKPDEAGFVLVGKPVSYDDRHPVRSVHDDRPAIMG